MKAIRNLAIVTVVLVMLVAFSGDGQEGGAWLFTQFGDGLTALNLRIDQLLQWLGEHEDGLGAEDMALLRNEIAHLEEGIDRLKELATTTSGHSGKAIYEENADQDRLAAITRVENDLQTLEAQQSNEEQRQDYMENPSTSAIGATISSLSGNAQQLPSSDSPRLDGELKLETRRMYGGAHGVAVAGPDEKTQVTPPPPSEDPVSLDAHAYHVSANFEAYKGSFGLDGRMVSPSGSMSPTDWCAAMMIMDEEVGEARAAIDACSSDCGPEVVSEVREWLESLERTKRELELLWYGTD